MRNNIIQAVMKAGYADGAFDEDYNIYSGGQVQFSMGPHSIVANPGVRERRLRAISTSPPAVRLLTPVSTRATPSTSMGRTCRTMATVTESLAPDRGAFES